MSATDIIFEYKGSVDFETIDPLIERLKKLPAYQAIKRSVQKRIYSIFVECVENIYKHSISESFYINDENITPYLSLYRQHNKYIIGTGNIVLNKSINRLRNRLEQINQMDRPGLKASYADIINKEFISDEDGAGLGLLTIALKTENKINYNFTSLDDQYSYFEMKIPI
ncbi:MAG: hypothetical protein AMS26_16070 [Bacteroides sp. SM23_62]|nr:MAG: hypothetical protein AMS26_16070 [Bacteroides sp. SM23_62]